MGGYHAAGVCQIRRSWAACITSLSASIARSLDRGLMATGLTVTTPSTACSDRKQSN